MPRARGIAGLCLGGALLLPVAAAAGDLDVLRPGVDWTVTIGAEGRVMPAFEGSDSYTLRPFPLFDIRRAGTPRRFKSPRDSWTVSFYDTEAFHIGAVGNVRLPRKESASVDLRGLGDVGWGVELGGFAEYWLSSWWRTRVELRQGVSGHHGLVSDFSTDLVLPVAPKLVLSGGPRFSLATGGALSPYYGVSAAQSATSGLPTYSTAGGARSFGLGAQARYEFSAQWASHVYIEYDHLLGSAANSPLVTLRGSRDQVTTGIGLTYAFDIPAAR
ncbi:MAG TPA: MipA/OmpV family protein [Pseudolabrys sp.]|nr:MipA/OmpV family protein [Pseudolabrys sp.]